MVKKTKKKTVAKKKKASSSKTIRPLRYGTGDPKLDKKIQELVRAEAFEKNTSLVTEMIVTALKIGADGMERGDLKMLNIALKELRYGLKVFYPYMHTRKVAVFGSARTKKTSPDYKIALRFSKEIVKKDWMVITGAATGIMQAGNEGAGREKSFGVNIRLPFEQEANPFIAHDKKLINFKYFFTRKLIFIRESDATVLCPGGFGTHDEGYESLTLIQTGKTPPRPVVCLDAKGSDYWKSWMRWTKQHLAKGKMIDEDDLGIIKLTQDPLQAVKYITDFYRNYHSSRYIGDRLIFRLHTPLTADRLHEINSRFTEILKKGKFEQYLKPFSDEYNEPHLNKFTRLAFYFNRRHFSRLYDLIDEVNKAGSEYK